MHPSFRHLLLSAVALSLTAGLSAQSAAPRDSFIIPERAVYVSGSHDNSRDLVAILYDASDLHYSDPSAPRFLFIDRKGRVALGIGGYLKGTLQYDFNGSIDDGSDFITYDIPVPADPSERQRFLGDVSQSTIFLRLVGRSTRFGFYQMYVQTNFSGDGYGKYGVKVKQAWASLGNVTMGLARSTFVDPSAGTPVIDSQGPTGEMGRKNVLVRYTKEFAGHWRVAGGIEMPSVTMTTNDDTKKISPRVPDIPVNIQYSWDKGASHVRLSGLLRNLSYRDMLSNKNKIATGWGVQLSSVIDFCGQAQLYLQGAYGKGYGAYINDLGGQGFDLVYSTTPGKMEAPRMCNYEIGAQYNFNPKFYVTASYSQARVFDLEHLGADTYRYGQYVSASAFYNIIDDLTLGAEYIYGSRTDFSGERGKANRVEAMLKYSF